MVWLLCSLLLVYSLLLLWTLMVAAVNRASSLNVLKPQSKTPSPNT